MVVPAQVFSAGVASARRHRDEVLTRLDAGRVLTFDSDTVLEWSPGPLTTFLAVAPASPETPDLGVLNVWTTLGETRDLTFARQLVSQLNGQATTSTWAVLGDPGPADFQPLTHPDSPAGAADDPVAAQEARRAVHLVSPPIEPETYQVSLGLTLTLGHHSVDPPLPVTVAMVADQVAWANQLAQDIGSADLPLTLSMTGSQVEDDEPPTAMTVASEVSELSAPGSDARTASLIAAFGRALASVQSQQSREPAGVWVGTTRSDSVVFEVPYSSGPFPERSIRSQGITGHKKPDHLLTSMVQVRADQHDRFGSGVRMTMRIPDTHGTISDPPWWSAALLNQLHRLSSVLQTKARAQGTGSWVVQNDSVVHSVFIPAGWADYLSIVDLEQFFEQLMFNAARLSWSARIIREPFVEQFHADLATPLPPTGLVAGTRARGPAFGEPGLGVNPVAAALDSVYSYVVGEDSQWVMTTPDGFYLDTGVSLLRVTAYRCACAESGCYLAVSTILQDLTAEQSEQLDQLVLRGLSAATIQASQDEPWRTVFTHTHTHDPQRAFSRAFPVAGQQVAVAAEIGGGIRLGARPQVDELISVPTEQFNQPVPNGGMGSGMEASAEVFGGLAIPLDWNSYLLQWRPGLAVDVEVRTEIKYRSDDLLGPLLVASTRLAAPDEQSADSFARVKATAAELKTDEVSGDVILLGNQIVVTTARSQLEDHSTTAHEHAQWVTSLASEHRQSVTDLLNLLTGPDAADPAVL